jgi:hypothetical protein
MSRADDLLRLAEELSNLHAPHHRQVDLSRAVSTAYYALFHLLVSEAAANWDQEPLRHTQNSDRTALWKSTALVPW